MINKEATIDFDNTRFVLFNNGDENIISLDQTRRFKQQGVKLTENAKNAIEEADEQAWYDHYVGRVEDGAWENA
jgi:hypothetical protein